MSECLVAHMHVALVVLIFQYLVSAIHCIIINPARFSTIQDKRQLLVPVVNVSTQVQEREADMKAVMESIGAICPNHNSRKEAINLAELVQMRKKQLRSFKRETWQFEGQLQVKREQLRRTSYVTSIERQRQMKLKAMFMEEMGQKRIKRLMEERRKKQSQTTEERKENNQRLEQRNQEKKVAEEIQTQQLQTDKETHRKDKEWTRQAEQKRIDRREERESQQTQENRGWKQLEEEKKRIEEERKQAAEKRRAERRQERERRWQQAEEERRREKEQLNKKQQQGHSISMGSARVEERRRLQAKEDKKKEEEQRYEQERECRELTEKDKRREKSQEAEEPQHQAEEELRKINEERKRQIQAEKERRRADEIRKLEQHRLALEEEERHIKEEKQWIQEQQWKQKESRRLAEQEMWLQREKRQQRPQWGVRKGSESPTSMEQRREQLWQQIQQQVQHEIDEERMWQQQQQQLSHRLVHGYNPLHAPVGQWGAMAPLTLHETRLPDGVRKSLGYVPEVHGMNSYGVSHHAPFLPYTTEVSHHQTSPGYRTASTNKFSPPLQRSNSEESLILLRQTYGSHTSRSPTILASPGRAAPSKKITISSQNHERHSPKPHQQKQRHNSDNTEQPAVFHHTYTAQPPSFKQKSEGKGRESRAVPVGTSSLPRNPHRHRQPPSQEGSTSSNNSSTQSTPAVVRNMASTANAKSDKMDSNWNLPSNRTSYPLNPVQIAATGGSSSPRHRTNLATNPTSRHRHNVDNSSRITHYPHHASAVPQPKSLSHPQSQSQPDSQSQSISYV